jgi:hypothetical protein
LRKRAAHVAALLLATASAEAQVISEDIRTGAEALGDAALRATP